MNGFNSFYCSREQTNEVLAQAAHANELLKQKYHGILNQCDDYRISQSEYDEKYVPWSFQNREAPLKPSNYSSIPLFEMSSPSKEWKSEFNDKFCDHFDNEHKDATLKSSAERSAGLKSVRAIRNPLCFAWRRLDKFADEFAEGSSFYYSNY